VSTVVEGPAPERARSKRDYPIIDCDVHPMMNSPKQLAPYLSAAWRERLNIGEYHQPTRRVPRGWYFPGQVDGNRMDAFPEGGGNAGSDQALMVKQVFEEAGIGYAALMANQTLFLGGVASADLAATVVSAFNDWIVNEWLTFDDRFRGSIAVTPQDPARAAAEIRRLAENPKMIQIFVATPSAHRLGNPFFDPIWDAAQEVGLPVVWHPGGGTPGGGIGGPPTSYIEGFAALTYTTQAQFGSVITEGVFEKFPKVKFGLIEGGILWVLSAVWRMRRAWLANRDELPWMKRAPEEYLAEHIRISTQPMEESGGAATDVYEALNVLHGDQWLIYASDYPHWDYDDPDFALRGFPSDWKRKIMYENPKAFYTRLDV
jgi:predicted TIM-barrel fold metal-dependent hydrolase